MTTQGWFDRASAIARMEDETLDVFVGSHVQALAMDRGALAQLYAESRNSSGAVIQASPPVTYASRSRPIVGVTEMGVVVGLGTGTTYVVATLERDGRAPLVDSIAVTVVLPNQ